jgi:hypothetical protein
VVQNRELEEVKLKVWAQLRDSEILRIMKWVLFRVEQENKSDHLLSKNEETCEA